MCHDDTQWSTPLSERSTRTARLLEFPPGKSYRVVATGHAPAAAPATRPNDFIKSYNGNLT